MRFKEFMENCMSGAMVDSVGVISAQNPQGVKLDDATNKKLNASLYLDLTSMGCKIKEVSGSFAGYSEDAFIVINISRSDLVNLGMKYGQAAIIWGYRSDDEFRFSYIEDGSVKQSIEMPYREQHVKNPNAMIDAISNGKFSIPYFFIR